MRKLKLIFCFLVFISCNALAQDAKPSILERLSGEWTADGKAFGMPAKIFMKWEPALEGKFMKLTYNMEMTTKDGKRQVFNGIAFYKPKGDGTFVATWVDSSGDMHPIAATVDGSTLVSVWGTPETKLGKTTYAFIDDDKVEIVDQIKRNDKWNEFNRNTVVRKVN
ncbi:MAG TPA: hypothetical protein VFE50_19905 [Cyclobacteriaceae bacterium]|nr:hypothetical protein [Cyclobacteriaceae bacterium]